MKDKRSSNELTEQGTKQKQKENWFIVLSYKEEFGFVSPFPEDFSVMSAYRVPNRVNEGSGFLFAPHGQKYSSESCHHMIVIWLIG